MGPPWRWLPLRGAPGAQQMALDEALLDEVAAGRSPPTVRCFRWQSPCITLGRFQGAGELDLDRCRAAGLAVVRRPTGGAAVLHGADLGYAVVLPAASLRPLGGPAGLYRAVGEALAAALRAMGLPAETRSGPGGRPEGACFAALGSCEVVVGNLKVVGSAQLRRPGATLQHGSIYAGEGPEAIAAYLRARPAWSEVSHRAGGRPPGNENAIFMGVEGPGVRAGEGAGSLLPPVPSLLPRPPALDLSGLVRRSLSGTLGVVLVEGRLSPAERSSAAELLRTKYQRAEWNVGT